MNTALPTTSEPATFLKKHAKANIPFQTKKKYLSPREKEEYVRWGHEMLREPSSVFPEQEWISISTNRMVRERRLKMYDILPCYGDDDYRTSSVRNAVMIPIGCFGDFANSRCSSCTLGRPLANFSYCGRKKFGAFLGDNFYPSGISHANDPRFERDLNAKFFRHPGLRMRYYAMVGNHDHNPQAQIRGIGVHPYWYMPQFFYSGDLIKADDTTLQVFVIDTHWGFEKSYPHLEEQASWLDSALRRSKAEWKIVMSHEPIFCFEDFDHNHGLVDFIHPVIVKHKVRIFVSAHVHGVFFHKVQGGYYQLISAGFGSDHHIHVKAKLARGRPSVQEEQRELAKSPKQPIGIITAFRTELVR